MTGLPMSERLKLIAGHGKREAAPDVIVPCSRCGYTIGLHLPNGASYSLPYICGLCEWAELHPEERNAA